MDNHLKSNFTTSLLIWFGQNHRPMPWKGEKDPYLIWLSEIILQQTRVEQGLPYFVQFKTNYPTIKALADAPEDEVMRLWQGLGYYTRARNLHATAKHITYTLNGSFPNTYSEILRLKGVGDYTAAAIASFAYNLSHAVVDGNVYRVLSRYFGIDTPIDSAEGKKEFTILANELIPVDRPADFNQAIMDFGATQCTPANPNCVICPLNKQCVGFNSQINDKLPVKLKKIKKKERFFHYLIINFDNFVYLQKRTQKDIWQNLYQFPLIETTKALDASELQTQPYWQAIFNNQNTIGHTVSETYKQVLTHQKISATFYQVDLTTGIDANFIEKEELIAVKKVDFQKFAFPKIIDLFLKQKILSLKLF